MNNFLLFCLLFIVWLVNVVEAAPKKNSKKPSPSNYAVIDRVQGQAKAKKGKSHLKGSC